MRERNTEPGD